MCEFQPEDLILYSSVVTLYALPQSILLKYRTDWNTFNRIQTVNSNVSTSKAQGIAGLSYYTYINSAERNSFINGQSLHTLYLPNSNWNTVQKN